MKRLLVLGLVLMGWSASVTAADYGFKESAARIAAVLASEAVAEAVHQAPMGSVANTGTREDGASEWTVQTQECDLVVYVIDGGTGPLQVDVPKACD